MHHVKGLLVGALARKAGASAETGVNKLWASCEARAAQGVCGRLVAAYSATAADAMVSLARAAPYSMETLTRLVDMSNKWLS